MNNAAATNMLVCVCLLTQREYALNVVIFIVLFSRNSAHCPFNCHLFLLIFLYLFFFQIIGLTSGLSLQPLLIHILVTFKVKVIRYHFVSSTV